MGPQAPQKQGAAAPAWVLAAALACSLLAMLGTPWARLPHSRLYLADHVILAQGAAQSLLEGGFPLRELPHAWLRDSPEVQRYPIFQFYSQVPPLLGGFLVLAGVHPYHAVVLVVGLFYAIGFLGMRRLALRAGGSPAAALLAAALFTLAPYHLTDWYARSAVSELAAFAFLPWVAAATWSLVCAAFWGPFLGGAFAWALLMLSHPLFHALGLLFMLALALGLALPSGNWRGLLRAAAAYAAGLALSLWFLAPGLLLGPHMGIATTFHPQAKALLTPLSVLFSPWRVVSPMSETDNLGLQVGVLLWGGWLAALFLARSRSARLLLPLAAAALFMVWSPLPIWDHLGPLKTIQFPYRLLVFVCLAGALPAAEGWLALQRRQKGMLALAALLALAVVWDMDFAKPIPVRPEDAWQGIDGCRVPFGEDDYSLSAQGPWEDELQAGGFRALDSRQGFSISDRDAQARLELARMGPTVRLRLKDVGPDSILRLPCFWYPGMYGVRVNGALAAYGRAGMRLALRLPAGRVDVEYRFRGLAWANWVSGLAWATLLAGLAGWALGAWRRRRGPQQIP
jgi:hypothetical protein